ncbi:MAG TPA: hypothetical protein VMY42_27790 [Thermoguttaceae bacterium]|nr:hypothetical protein [Thermoguttaceae bacterium]
MTEKEKVSGTVSGLLGTSLGAKGAFRAQPAHYPVAPGWVAEWEKEKGAGVLNRRERLEVSLLAENPSPPHGPIEPTVRKPSAGNSQSSQYARKLPHASPSAKNKDSRRPFLNPDLEGVRAQVVRLARMVDDNR